MISDAEKLIDFRKSQKLSQQQLALELNVTQSTISMIEAGMRKVSSTIKLALLQKYGIRWEGDKIIKEDTKSDIISIPVYNISASAGKGEYLMDEPENDVLYFDKRFLNHILKTNNFNSLHIIYAKGDSMDSGWNQPDDIKDGDLLMIDTSQTSGNNQIFVVIVNNTELRVKRLFKRDKVLYISSNNPKYKEEVYYPNDENFEVKIIGKVVWNGSKENV